MLPETKEYLDGLGYVFEDRLAYSRIMAALRPHVPTINSIDDVEAECGLVQVLREQALGSSQDEDVDKDLNYLVGDILSTSTEGRMQKSLENGYVLCGLRVRRAIVPGDEATSMSARFISADPEIVETYSTTPAIDRAVKATSKANDNLDMTGRRIPQLALRRPALTQHAQGLLSQALPLATPGPLPPSDGA